MRKSATIIFMLFFLLNTIIVSAWAKPCMQYMDTPSNIQKSLNSDMPCHNENNDTSNNTNKHCDGICLCAHVTYTPTFMMKDTQILSFNNLSEEALIISQYKLASRNIEPPLLPPKVNS